MLELRNVTFMTTEPGRLADFWAAALGLSERRDLDAEVIVAPADWSYPRYTFQQVAAARAHQALHLDLRADVREQEVRRLVRLGATEGDTHGTDDLRWTVMRDPDGNEFCITDP